MPELCHSYQRIFIPQFNNFHTAQIWIYSASFCKIFKKIFPSRYGMKQNWVFFIETVCIYTKLHFLIRSFSRTNAHTHTQMDTWRLKTSGSVNIADTEITRGCVPIITLIYIGSTSLLQAFTCPLNALQPTT